MKIIYTSLFLLLSIINIQGEDKIDFKRIYRKKDFIFEQNQQAQFQVRYPGLVKGIYNYAIAQSDFQKEDKQDGQTTDELCWLQTDVAIQTGSQVHITLTELTNSLNNPKIITLAHNDFNKDKMVYLLTDDKDVIQVKLNQQFTLVSKKSIQDIYTTTLSQSNRLQMIIHSKSKKLFVIGNQFIASKLIKEDEDFSKTEFIQETSYKKCEKVENVLIVEDYIIISCNPGGLNFYKINNDGQLIYEKTYEEKKSIIQASYNKDFSLLAFLDGNGIRFIKFIEGQFGQIITDFSIGFQGGKSFSQNNMQTFWIQGEYQINEIFVDINSQVFENNGSKPSSKQLVGTYLTDIYGIVFNESSYSIYIHSIPHSIISEFREKIYSQPLEDTEQFIVIENPNQEGITSILSVTQKSLKLNTLQFIAPEFRCNPRDDTGKFEYKLKIYSQECETSNTTELFYQCIIEDTITMKINKAYVTSSNQNLAIGLGVGLTCFFLGVIVLLYILYRKKKLILTKMEDQARNLRQQKYVELQQEKVNNSNYDA